MRGELAFERFRYENDAVVVPVVVLGKTEREPPRLAQRARCEPRLFLRLARCGRFGVFVRADLPARNVHLAGALASLLVDHEERVARPVEHEHEHRALELPVAQRH